jgi:ATP-dependent Clp protease ATP-binding subunit ClpC
MTSNIGSKELAKQARMGFDMPEEGATHQAMSDRYEELKATVVRELKGAMAPELLGRIDQTIVFSPLTQSDMLRITSLHIDELQKRLQAKNIKVDVSKGVLEEIAERAFLEGAGARPIRRIVQELLEDPIASSLVSDEATEGRNLQARKTGGKIKVTSVEKLKAHGSKLKATKSTR